MQIAYQGKDYPKAIEFGNRAYQANQDPEIGIYIANAYYITDDFQNTKRVMSEVVAKQEGAGKAPDEQTYRILQSACLNLKDEPCVNEQIEKLVAHYPKPTYWADLINSLLRSSRNDKELLNILRLADGADALRDAAQYLEFAQLAMGQGLPGEAQAAIEKGTSKGVFAGREKEHATRILAEAKQAVTLDKSTLDKQDASARAKTTGEADVKLGAAYLSYGDLPKAVESLQRGLGKGGVKNPDEANLLLGIAHRRANNQAEAEKAFNAVTQDPAMARIARLWLLNKSPGGPAAAG
jgi:tetratricopeptide (TPR) repeat protein